jgi:hypothetical protein
MRPAVLACEPCGLRLEGRFEAGSTSGASGNEFAQLGPDELHLLRIFVHCEGSIRDMEAALGISYPTVKSRVAALKLRLEMARTPPTAAVSTVAPEVQSGVAGTGVVGGVGVGVGIEAILAELVAGRISAADASLRIRRAKGL